MRRHLAVIALVAVACATVAAYPSTSRAPVARMALLAPCIAPDSAATIRISWEHVMDARGDSVSEYVGNLHANGDTVAAWRSPDTVRQVDAPCPQYGDSTALFAEVQAVDRRGNAGPIGRSNTIVLRTSDPGPPAPVITIDTIPVATEELIDSFTVAFERCTYGGVEREGCLNDADELDLVCRVAAWGKYMDAPVQTNQCIEAEQLRRARSEGLALLVYGGPSS